MTAPRGLHLHISSLGQVLVEEAQVQAIRAEDASGHFGLRPGHADFLTVLPVSVLSWRSAAAAPDDWRHCALRGGVLTVQAGQVRVATREAILGQSLAQLEAQVLAELRHHHQRDEAARRDARALEARTLTELLRYLRPLRGGGATGAWR